ncbi:NAD(P)/FAD-dependent oxidoreductase [Acinetobacter sichuanensis]|uniref:NAD(P)/FAD-dependent oxidoreductase n=1 Tax=Acinetobacter sichuanensis TaxID=2136183 RepID=A0A371YQX3_9GAMM|nr:NAD(P)/FAD-dependent oxidoreductase [Acinetobacter sichuanensis]RFC83877.1 NAD(P)/FAD-dependent oxidoreductase [Acinetobacter sichuanensis]
MNYEVVIIGGSYAGLSAALPLARARRQILIIDAGQRRNRFAEYSHNFLTQDGQAPNTIAEEAREQVKKYSTVSWLCETVTDVKAVDGQYVVFAGEQQFQAEKIIIATGIKDELPQVEGLTERWGKSIYHCPYCDGYELNMGEIGVLASGMHSLHQALMLPDWGNTTLFLNDAIKTEQLDDELLAKLSKRQIVIETRQVARIENHCDVVFVDEERTTLDGLFVSTVTRLQANWIRNLGLDIDSNEYGEAIKTSPAKETNIKGIYACGDVTRSGGSVALSVGDGAMTGIVAHKSFIF